MNNLEKYNQTFITNFNLDEVKLPELKYQDISDWDSVGHMELMSKLEEVFGVELDIDDIIGFSSYQVGKEILKKYNVSFDNF